MRCKWKDKAAQIAKYTIKQLYLALPNSYTKRVFETDFNEIMYEQNIF